MIARLKRLSWWIVAGVVSVVAAGASWGLYRVDVHREMERQSSALVTLRELRQFALEDYLQTIRSELLLYSEGERVREAMRRLADAWRQSGPDSSSPLDGLHRDGSKYWAVHADIHPWAVRFREHHGYYDVFLIDTLGNVVYSVAKEDDFGTNLIDGPWRDTDFGGMVRAALEASAPDFVAFSDFESYTPSDGRPASFVGSPIFDSEGSRLGVLAVQVPTDRINKILQFTPGMGETGETYLVGADYLMRTDSRFADSSTILRTRVETEAARRALAGESGAGVVSDYRGVRVLSAFGPIRFEGTKWALLAEIDEAEIRSRALVPRRLAGLTLISIGLLGTVVALGLMAALSRSARPTPWTDEP